MFLICSYVKIKIQVTMNCHNHLVDEVLDDKDCKGKSFEI
jgi:hypothetical protein